MDIYGCTEPAERGLRCYVHRVASGLGLGPESTYCELAPPASAYLALEDRLADWPDRDTAVVWDDQRGWAVGVETASGEDLLVVAWYGPDLVPAPEEVVRFVKNALTGHYPSPARPPCLARTSGDALSAHLADYWSRA